MNILKSSTDLFSFFSNKINSIDFIAPLLLRVYLAPIFILAGINKASSFESTAAWFGNPEWGLGLPAPALLAALAIFAEIAGGLALLFGFALRLMVFPLLITMIVAATTAHWDKGWHALPDAELTMPWEWRKDLIDGAVERRSAARSILKEHGNYEWLTETGSITVLKNGIEFAATYFIMLICLLITGAGRWISVDYWLGKWVGKMNGEKA